LAKQASGVKTPKDLAAALAALEQHVEQLETGEIALEAALEAFESGTALVRQCQEILNNAEQTVQRLQNDIDGNASLENFSPAEET